MDANWLILGDQSDKQKIKLRIKFFIVIRYVICCESDSKDEG